MSYILYYYMYVRAGWIVEDIIALCVTSRISDFFDSGHFTDWKWLRGVWVGSFAGWKWRCGNGDEGFASWIWSRRIRFGGFVKWKWPCEIRGDGVASGGEGGGVVGGCHAPAGGCGSDSGGEGMKTKRLHWMNQRSLCFYLFNRKKLFRCDPGEARTLDPMIKSHLLYQLSYGVKNHHSAERLRPQK